MKTIVLSVVLAAVLIQVVDSQTTAKALVKSGTGTTAKALVKSGTGTTAKALVKSGTGTTAKSLVKSGTGTTGKAPLNSTAIAKSPVKSGTTAKASLRCHVCELPEGCKRHNETNCGSTQDTCVKIHRPIYDPSGTENKNNYYAKYAQGIMVWGRGCSTKAKCQTEKEKKMKGFLKTTVECCYKPLCNA